MHIYITQYTTDWVVQCGKMYVHVSTERLAIKMALAMATQLGLIGEYIGLVYCEQTKRVYIYSVSLFPIYRTVNFFETGTFHYE